MKEEYNFLNMFSLYFQIPIFLLLLVCAYKDYKTRIVPNRILFFIGILSLPLVYEQKSFYIPIVLSVLFLILFYTTDQIGGADTKGLIILIWGMSKIDIFVFFLMFTIVNIPLIFKYQKGIPLFISISFGYLGVILISLLPEIIKIIYGE